MAIDKTNLYLGKTSFFPKYFVLLCCSLPSLFSFFWPKPVLPYSLYLKGRQVFGSEVRLGDLGRLTNADNPKALSEKLVARNLRRPVYLQARKLKALLKNATPEKIEKIYGSGIWLIPENKTLDAKKIRSLLMRQIAELPGSAGIEKRIQIRIGKGSVLKIPAKGVELKFRLPAHARSLTPGKRILALDIYAVDFPDEDRDGLYKKGKQVRNKTPEHSGQNYKKFLLRKSINIEIRRWVTVGVAKRDLPIGHRLQESDFRMERRAVFGSKRDYELGRSLVGLRAVRRIHAGEDLTLRNVQHLPAVRRGQSVKLVYQTPGLVLRIQSVALRDAETGEELKVRVVLPGGRYGKTLQARVADKGVVVAK